MTHIIVATHGKFSEEIVNSALWCMAKMKTAMS